jgi:glycosyltransferase involved in cell wall biosynthesis
MRALLDARMRAGGVGRYARDLIREFRRPEFHLDAIAFEGSRLVPPFAPWSSHFINRRARDHDVDVIHGLHFEVPKRRSDGLVVTIPDVIPLVYPDSMLSSRRRALFKKTLERSLEAAHRIISPSSQTVTDLLGLGADPAKMTAIPHGVSPGWHRAGERERHQARARFAGGRSYIASVANDRPHKNLASLAAAARELRRSTDVEIVCRGQTTRALDPIRFLPPLSDPDLCLFYGGAELLVVPSVIEGYGLPALEALACGTPVVCGDRVGVLERISSCAVVVDVSEPSLLATAVGSLLSDEPRRSRMVEVGAEVIKELTSSAMARATLQQYESAISQSG